MRQGLTLTKKERNQTQKAISKLDQSYQQGRVNPMVYRSQRGKLLANLKRPMAERTPINLNQESWFKRSEVHRGPAPVGYWNHNVVSNGPVRQQVSSNKIRASLIDISNNGYWNSQDFQDALQTASAANRTATENNASYFQQAVMKSESLGSAQSTLSAAGLWESIQGSPPVAKALLRLESTINYTIQRMYAVGVSKQEAKASIRQVAISSGQAMTSQGYSKEKAAEIIAMVVRGELGLAGAITRVSSDLNNVAENIAALNHDTNASVVKPSSASQYAAAWNNNFNIHGNGTPTGISMSALMQAKNQLEQKFDLSNNPVERNQLSQSISQMEKTLNQRQQGVNNSAANATRKPHSSTNGPVTASYNPRNNLHAKTSTMQQTSAALNRGGPSIVTVVKDLFTVDSNIYLDWTAGTPISVTGDGAYSAATNNSDPSSVFSSGEWTVFASNRKSIPTLKSIINSIGYALASPLWSDNDRAYLLYLKQSVVSRITALESGVFNNQNNAINQSPIVQNNAINQSPIVQNNAINQSAIVQNQSANGMDDNPPQFVTPTMPINNGNKAQQQAQQNANAAAKAQKQAQQNANAAAKAAQQQAQRNANAAAKAQQQAQQQAQRNANAAAKAQQQAQRNANAAAQQQAQRNANAAAQQQAQRNANAAAQQQAQRNANAAAKAAQQQAQRNANAAAKAAQQKAQRNAEAGLKKIRNGGGGGGGFVVPGRGGGFPRGGFFGALGGSTSNTTSTRSHGGARFVQDPRSNHRTE